MIYTGMAQAKLTGITLRLQRESAINNKINNRGSNHSRCVTNSRDSELAEYLQASKVMVRLHKLPLKHGMRTNNCH